MTSTTHAILGNNGGNLRPRKESFMSTLLERLQAAAATDHSGVVSSLSTGVGLLAAFFNAQMLAALLGFLVVDLFTGLWKAKTLNKVASSRFADAIDRGVFYLVVYGVLHVLTLVLPLGQFAAIPESLVMTGYVFKEALSILENLKAIQVAKGETTPLIDGLIQRLGMDMDKITGEVANTAVAALEAQAVAAITPTPEQKDVPGGGGL